MSFFWKQLSLLGVVLLFCIAIFFVVDEEKTKNIFPIGADIGGRTYRLEIADTDAKRKHGLSGRDDLCTACGMLFVFETERQYAFWMKDMLFSIDIIWLLGDEIVFIQRDVQPDFSGILNPAIVADRVLELNTGGGDTLRVGEKIQFVYEE